LPALDYLTQKIRRKGKRENVKYFSAFLIFTILMFLAQDNFAKDNSEGFLNSIRQGDIKKVEEYIDKGADVNLIKNERQTPLMYAIWSNNFEIVKLLVSKGADVNLKPEKGEPL
jgi:hypothetical protein